jgi:hypothetical protein
MHWTGSLASEPQKIGDLPSPHSSTTSIQPAASSAGNGVPRANHACPPPPPPRPPVKRALQIPIADPQTDNETNLVKRALQIPIADSQTDNETNLGADDKPPADAVKADGVWNADEHGGTHAPRTVSAENRAKGGGDVSLVSEEVDGRARGAALEVGGVRGRPPFVPKLNLKDASLLGVSHDRPNPKPLNPKPQTLNPKP